MRPFLLALTAAFLLVAAPASAAPSWLAPVELGSEADGTSSIGDVALAPDGTAVAAWAQPTPDGTNTNLQVARRPVGQGFGAPITIPLTTGAGSVQVGIDAGDNATIAWSQGTAVSVVSWPAAAAAPGAVQSFTTGAAGPVPALAVGNPGTAVVAWVDTVTTVVNAAARPGAGGTFAAPAPISGATATPGSIELAVGDSGEAIAVWSRTVGGATVIEANERTPGGAFAAAGVSISDTFPGQLSSDPVVVVDSIGRATALWSSNSASIVQFAEHAQGAANWSAFARASQVTDSASSPAAGVAPDGTVIAAWAVDRAGGSNVVETAIRPATGAFAAYRDLSGPSMSGYTPLVAVGAGGDAIFSWSVGMQEAVYTVQRTRGGVYGPILQAVSNGGQAGTNFFLPSLGVDDQGNGVAGWTRTALGGVSGNVYRFQAGSFDAAAPSLSSSVPPGGTAGVAVPMAAAATDRLTPVSLTWAFGDGTTASGGAVSHAFGVAGAFNVTATATDGVGNATSRTSPVLVAAAPPPKKKRITSRVRVTWGVAGKRIFLLRLQIGNAPKGAKAELRCKKQKGGRKCPFSRFSSKKRKKGTITLFKEIKAKNVVGKRRRSFRAGQTLQVRITKKAFIGKVVRYKLEKGKIPSGKNLCLPAGKKKPRQRC